MRLRHLALAVLPLAVALNAQTVVPKTSTRATAPSPNLAGIAHVAIRVHDLAVAIAFYEKLGFVKAFDLSRDGQVYEAFIKINDRQFIELYPATPKDTQIGFLHLCFEGADLHAAHNFYVAEGLTPKDVKVAGAGNLLFTMPGPATPTGPQNLEYTQYMPGSLHSRDFGQHLGADRIATEMVGVTVAVDALDAAETFYVKKLAFTPHGKPVPSAGLSDLNALPGNASEAVQLTPEDQLGFRARITLKAKQGAAVALRQRGIAFKKAAGAVGGVGRLTVTDPDGNEIVLRTTP